MPIFEIGARPVTDSVQPSPADYDFVLSGTTKRGSRRCSCILSKVDGLMRRAWGMSPYFTSTLAEQTDEGCAAA
jgi:hypothetical protein